MTSSSLIDSANSTGSWDIISGKIQAPVAPGGTSSKIINFGGGTDGTFSDGPTQTGISVSGSTVTFLTDTKNDFHFSSFNLSSGITLRVSGSQPLIVRVLGTTTVAGTINLNGSAGTDNNLGINPPTGGTSSSGGGSGGNGAASTGTAATTGNASTPSGGGGIGANNSLVGGLDQGGGGGCLGNSGVAAEDSQSGQNAGANAGSCATARSTAATNFETTFTGGGGGGGGGAYTGAGPIAGGAGGGGGGAIRILSQGTVTVSGSILAQGGGGGVNNAINGAHCGGGGGGGSGGSVWIQSASAVAGAGSINVTQGAGGAMTGACAGAYDGGHGSNGIIRVDRSAGSVTYTPAASAQSNVTSIPFPTGGTPYVVLSKAIDFSNGFYDFLDATETVDQSVLCGNQGTVVVKYEGSFNGTTYSSPVLKANLSQLNGYPYLRIRTEISTTGATPPCLTGLSLQYQPSDLSNLNLKGGMFFCGSISTSGSSPLNILGDLIFIALAFVASSFLKKKHLSY